MDPDPPVPTPMAVAVVHKLAIWQATRQYILVGVVVYSRVDITCRMSRESNQNEMKFQVYLHL